MYDEMKMIILEALSYKINKPKEIKNPMNQRKSETTSRMSYESNFMFWEKEEYDEENQQQEPQKEQLEKKRQQQFETPDSTSEYYDV